MGGAASGRLRFNLRSNILPVRADQYCKVRVAYPEGSKQARQCHHGIWSRGPEVQQGVSRGQSTTLKEPFHPDSVFRKGALA